MKVNHDSPRITEAFGVTRKNVKDYLASISNHQQLIDDFYSGRVEAMVAVGFALKDAYGYQNLTQKNGMMLYELAEIYTTPSRTICVLQKEPDDESYVALVREAVENNVILGG